MEVRTKLEVDEIGRVKHDCSKDWFLEYYSKNQSELDKISSRTLNRVFRISEGNKRYKVERRKGVTRLVRVSDYDISRSGLAKRIDAQEQILADLKHEFEKKSDNNSGESTEGTDFYRGLLQSIQNQSGATREKI